MDETVLLLVVLWCAAVLGVILAFYYTLYRALKLAGEHSRMSPGLVFLNLIPLFGSIWFFVTVIRVSEAVKGKCRELELEEGDGGYGFGLASAILSMNAPALSNMAGYRNPAFIAAMLVSLIMLIVYWSVIARYNRIFSLWGQ